MVFPLFLHCMWQLQPVQIRFATKHSQMLLFFLAPLLLQDWWRVQEQHGPLGPAFNFLEG